MTHADTPAKDTRPNFIVFIVDDVGYEDIGAFGSAIAQTPNIDQLARDGMRFENAFVTAAVCNPSRASILTGLYPHSTGAPALNQPLPATVTLLTQYLKSAGYYTESVGKWHLGENVKHQWDKVVVEHEDTGTIDWVPELLKRPRDKPFFFWLASHDAHRPYEWTTINSKHNPYQMTVRPPDIPSFDLLKEMALYHDEISHADSEIGAAMRVLRSQEDLDNTVIIFLSDNGALYGRGKGLLTDAGLRTPLIVRWPRKITHGTTNTQLISTVDIAPTILELAGIPVPANMQGTSMIDTLRDPAIKVRDYAFSERGDGLSWMIYHERAVRSSRYIYKRNPHTHQLRENHHVGCDLGQNFIGYHWGDMQYEELYDTETDPEGRHNLIKDPAMSGTATTLRLAMNQWIQDTKDQPPPLIFGPCKKWPLHERFWINN